MKNAPYWRKNRVLVAILIAGPVSGIAGFWPLFGTILSQGAA
jgi:hypothetical protein